MADWDQLQYKPVWSSLEPLAHGEVDEEVDAAVDGEAEVADSKHGAGDEDKDDGKGCQVEVMQ